MQEKDAEIAELREQVEALTNVPAELAALEAHLAALTRRLDEQADVAPSSPLGWKMAD